MACKILSVVIVEDMEMRSTNLEKTTVAKKKKPSNYKDDLRAKKMVYEDPIC